MDYKKLADFIFPDITKTIEDNTSLVKIDNIENELIYTYYTGWRYFKVIPFSNPRFFFEQHSLQIQQHPTITESVMKRVDKSRANILIY